MENLNHKRGVIKGKLTRFSTYLDTFEENKNYAELRIRKNNAEVLLSQFDEIQSSIELEGEDPLQVEERKTFEADYFRLLAQAENILDLQTKAESANNKGRMGAHGDVFSQVKLPPINLPIFDGAYDQWQAFYDTFTSLIDANVSLNSIQKFHYLRSSLKDNALEVIQSIEVSADNYKMAWVLLKNRFENKKYITQTHIKAIFNLQQLFKDDYTQTRQLSDNVQKHIRALKSLGQPTETWDVPIVYLLSTKLDPVSRREWEAKSASQKELLTYKDFVEFLQQRCQILESLDKSQMSGNVNKPSVPQFQRNTRKSNQQSTFVTTQNEGSLVCPVCNNKSHKLFACKKFIALSPQERVNEVRRLKLCYNCLASDHPFYQCQASFCRKCGKKHNTLIHINYTKNNATAHQIANSSSQSQLDNNIQQNENASQIISHCSHAGNTFSQVLLATALVEIFNNQGSRFTCRVLLDSASQSNFITKATCQKLGLKPKQVNIPVKGINSASTHVTETVEVIVKSRLNSYKIKLNFLVLSHITENLPLVTINMANFEIPSHIQLADPEFHKSGDIEMLIGAEVYFDLLCIGQINSQKRDCPTLHKTKFGWVVSGKTSFESQLSYFTTCSLSTNEMLYNQLKQFWELQEVDTINTNSQEEIQCETHFKNNISREKNGRFSVRLPFNENKVKLGNSREMAEKRFHYLEKRLEKHPQLREQYKQFINEYFELGHMSLSAHDNNMGFFLPHHAVVRDDSITTRLRVVFDGSAKTSTGLSLNDVLLKGPTIQETLFSILIRFRTFNIVMTADIEKMYRQINIHNDDQCFQKILWRDNPNNDLQSFTLRTVTYGTTSAPFLAVRCLKELAITERTNFPLAAEILDRDFYVDDVLTGAATIEEAQKIHTELTALLRKGCFELRKWRSNNPQILNETESEAENYKLPLEKLESTKTLGVTWNSNLDIFKFNIHPYSASHPFTKRTVLSGISLIFDPLGLIGPVITTAKLILQRLWQLSLDWDESLPASEYTKWRNLQEQLPTLNSICIPRRVTRFANYTTIELHGFSDASEIGYGSCIYILTTDSQGRHSSQLLCSKGRVAPLASTTLPRLELCAALLLAQLFAKLKKCLTIKFNSHHFWTDSTIVLAWLASPPNAWKTFVANRVAEIQTKTNIQDWSHVGTNDNPADALSRGLLPEQLLHNNLWWNGPSWLQQDFSHWPNVTTTSNLFTDKELEKRKQVCLITTQSLEIFEKFSSLTRLKRVTAYCLRFVHNLRTSSNLTGSLTVDELNNSEICLLKLAQKDDFSKEISNLKSNNCVRNNSRLLSLNPFLDEYELIRVGGRIRRAQIPYDVKHPIVLSSNHPLTTLIIRHEHFALLHAGPQAVLASLRTRFWPLSGRNAVRKITRNCIICFKVKPVTVNPTMGDLPFTRINRFRPFQNVGVDYCGPITLKERRRSGRTPTFTCYIAIFICLSTKAVHLELVQNLTTDSFIAALKRFMARRGKCSSIYSDNATNFVKANKDLKHMIDLFSSDKHWEQIHNHLANQAITWHYIPPRSPTFGGLWEAAVKSAKYHLRRITGNEIFTYEEYLTFLNQIEACLNSRPLTPISNDPNDLLCLTPSHFLIGDSLHSHPEPNYTQTPVNRLTRWNYIQQLFQHFWRRWSTEYLQQLQQRSKWSKHTTQEQAQVGSMVLLKDDNLPPLQWKQGRIIEVFPGDDNVVRVVLVKTNHGEYRRALNKVCILPLDVK